MELLDIAGVQPLTYKAGFIHYLSAVDNDGKYKISIIRTAVDLDDSFVICEKELLVHLRNLIKDECPYCENTPEAIAEAKNKIKQTTNRGDATQIDDLILYKGVNQIDSGIIVYNNTLQGQLISIPLVRWEYFLTPGWQNYYINIQQ